MRCVGSRASTGAAAHDYVRVVADCAWADARLRLPQGPISRYAAPASNAVVFNDCRTHAMIDADFRCCLGLLTLALLAACTDLPRRAMTGEEVSAQAGCAVLIEALERARAQPQVAQFLVDEADHLLAPDPVAFRSGDIVHEGSFGAIQVRRLEHGRDPLVDALRAAGEAGLARCEVAGRDTYRGAGVTRISFAHPKIEPRHNPVTLLVDDATQLPVHHTYSGIGGRGFAWVYGEVHAATAENSSRRGLRNL